MKGDGSTPDGGGRNGGGVAAASGSVINGAGGRFVGTGEFTEKEAAFIQFYVSNGGNAMDAAREAGYAVPRVDGWKLKNRPHIRAAIEAHCTGKAWALRMVALAATERVLNDKGQPGDVTVKAIREAREFAAELDAIRAKADAKAEAMGIADGSGQVEFPPEYADLLAALRGAETMPN